MILHTNTLKNNLISGTLLLTLTGILSRIIGFYYKIFLSRTIGAEGLGIYQLIFPVFALIIAVSAAGIQTAISRYCAQCQTEQQARRYLVTGLVLSLLLSGICITFMQTYAPWIGSVLLEDARTVSLLRLMTFSLPFACIHSCINGYYFGKKKAAIPSVSQLLEQLVRVAGVWLLIQILTEQGNLPSPVRGSDCCALFRYHAAFFTRKKSDANASFAFIGIVVLFKGSAGAVYHGTPPNLQPYFVKYLSKCRSNPDSNETAGFWLHKQ